MAKMRYFIVRIGGAWGDIIITTPLLRYLKENGHEVYMLTGKPGQELLKNNPNVDKIIYYETNSVPISKLDEFIKSTAQAYECDQIVNLCESIEVALALHPDDPRYNWTKEERRQLCDKNYYDYTFEKAGFPGITGKRGELFFDEHEEKKARKFFAYIKADKETRGQISYFIILWGLSGSGRNKTYLYAEKIMNRLLAKYQNIKIVTVGDDVCRLLETLQHPRITHLSGLWSMRKSMIAAKYANLVISPDTGLLHAAGCFSTPKIGLLGHSTITNITKNFINDCSIEANCKCAPCFRLVYNAEIQCPAISSVGDNKFDTCECMSNGLDENRVFNHICKVYEQLNKGTEDRSTDRSTTESATEADVSCMSISR